MLVHWLHARELAQYRASEHDAALLYKYAAYTHARMCIQAVQEQAYMQSTTAYSLPTQVNSSKVYTL
jgi:hypothetical protein